MYLAKEVKGQLYSNRIRNNIQKIMESRDMAGSAGLPHMTKNGLYKFVSGRGDITVTRLQIVADDLGVSIFELLQAPKKD
jgi:hypothetical protein